MTSLFDDKMIANEETIRCDEKSEKRQAEIMSFGEPITLVGAWAAVAADRPLMMQYPYLPPPNCVDAEA